MKKLKFIFELSEAPAFEKSQIDFYNWTLAQCVLEYLLKYTKYQNVRIWKVTEGKYVWLKDYRCENNTWYLAEKMDNVGRKIYIKI